MNPVTMNPRALGRPVTRADRRHEAPPGDRQFLTREENSARCDSYLVPSAGGRPHHMCKIAYDESPREPK